MKCTVASLEGSGLSLIFESGVPQQRVEFSDAQMANIVVMSDRLQQFHEIAPVEYVSINTSIPAATVPVNRCTGEVYRTVRLYHKRGLFADTSTFEQNDVTVGSDGDGAIARAERALSHESGATHSQR